MCEDCCDVDMDPMSACVVWCCAFWSFVCVVVIVIAYAASLPLANQIAIGCGVFIGIMFILTLIYCSCNTSEFGCCPSAITDTPGSIRSSRRAERQRRKYEQQRKRLEKQQNQQPGHTNVVVVNVPQTTQTTQHNTHYAGKKVPVAKTLANSRNKGTTLPGTIAQYLLDNQLSSELQTAYRQKVATTMFKEINENELEEIMTVLQMSLGDKRAMRAYYAIERPKQQQQQQPQQPQPQQQQHQKAHVELQSPAHNPYAVQQQQQQAFIQQPPSINHQETFSSPPAYDGSVGTNASAPEKIVIPFPSAPAKQL